MREAGTFVGRMTNRVSRRTTREGKTAMLALLGCVLWLVACRGDVRVRSSPPSSSPPPRSAWLCRPDRSPDPCATSDLRATELDGEHAGAIVPHTPDPAPKADCFYVYPTVDLDLVPRIHEDLRDTSRELATTRAQAMRFTEACALWVPLYRQVTLGTWLQPREERERLLAIAFEDVERAFSEYLAQAPPSRPIVLIGHSQGAEMVVRLLRRFFDHDEAMRRRLLLAMPIGGEVEVPVGKTSGGTLTSIPVCTQPLQTGCIVAYRTHFAKEPVDPSRWAPKAGLETVCVDPSALDRETPRSPDLLSRAFFGVEGPFRPYLRHVSDVTTPFVELRDVYEARCVHLETGYGYLAVDDHGRGPIDLASPFFRIGKLGLHVLDLQFTQGDLVDLVARRVAVIGRP